jgi:integrase
VVVPLAKVKQFPTDLTPNVRYLSTDERAKLLDALNAREERAKAERESANLWRSQRDTEPLPDLSQVAFIDHLMPMILVSLNTGVRRGELFNMQWSNMHFDTQIITVLGNGTKNSKPRHIPMNSLVVSTLKSWHKQTGGTGYVFPSKNDERMQDVKTAWGALLKKAQITSFRWHDQRNDFASQLVMRGVPLNTVRDLLGHSDIKMTLRYAHLAPENTANAVELLT